MYRKGEHDHTQQHSAALDRLRLWDPSATAREVKQPVWRGEALAPAGGSQPAVCFIPPTIQQPR